MFGWLKHKHCYHVVVATYHPAQLDVMNGVEVGSHYTYERTEYDFCVSCGEKKGSNV